MNFFVMESIVREREQERRREERRAWMFAAAGRPARLRDVVDRWAHASLLGIAAALAMVGRR